MNNDAYNVVVSPSFSDYESVDYYKEARDSFLKRKFTDYSNLELKEFKLSFSIRSTAKNSPILYTVLENFPKELYSANKNDVVIKMESERDFLNHITSVSDILAIVKTWKSTTLQVNKIEIGTTTEFRYLVNFLFEKNNLNGIYLSHSVDEIKKKYNTHKIISRKIKSIGTPIIISRDNVIEALNNVVEKYVALYGYNKTVTYYDVSQHDRVVMIEDSLIIDFRIIPCYWTRKDDEHFNNWEYPYILIQELTHNDLFKFNFADFKRRFQCNHISMDYYPYHGVHYYREEIDNFDVVDKRFPELKLQERYNKYTGETHHFIILRMESVDGSIAYGVGDTKGKIHSFVLKLCKELETKNSRSLEINGASCLPYGENCEFVDAFLSWKGEKKRWRLENKFSYFYEDRQVKNDAELFRIPIEIIKVAKSGAYNECEFVSYNKPLNRWKSEELVYNITKKLYSEYQVLYQYRPFYLSTEKGNMSYDIYICGLKIAIEYQGKQHFEPVDYFGGVENFQRQKERDELKARRSKENGVRLIYVNYWEDITPNLIKSKIEEYALTDK